MSKETIKAAAAAIEVQLDPTDEELLIAARLGVSREQLIQQKALDRLDDREIQMMRGGLTAVEILAARIVR